MFGLHRFSAEAFLLGDVDAMRSDAAQASGITGGPWLSLAATRARSSGQSVLLACGKSWSIVVDSEE